MNEQLYRVSTVMFRWLCGFDLIARPLDLISKVWLRHRKLQIFLQAQQFDGVIDGGANVGEFANLARGALPSAHLICVEPHPECARVLRKDGFEVVEAALWDKPSRLSLVQPASSSTSSTILPVETEHAMPRWEIDAVRLDSLPITGNRLLVKLDLQGAELQALDGMTGLWERCGGMLLEVSVGAGGNYEEIRETLARHGFYEYATTNELMVDGRIVEADKLWLRN